MLNSTTSGKPTRLIGLGLTALLGLTASITALAEDFFEYKGSEWCAACHIDRYSGWQGTAHGKMLMSCEDSLNRAIPLPEGYTCEDISYVIGGHGQKALFLDSEGYLITSIRDRDGNESPGQNQWNLGTGRWTDLHAGETGIPYDCGGCHSTGWVQDKDPDTDGDLSDNQDGLPGIHGTYEYPGVGCEACHGPGYTMLVYEDSQTCGTCHAREPEFRIQAADGYILNYQQYNEVLSSPHASFSCVTCHNPHESGEGAMRRTCETCHGSQAESYAGSKMQLAGVECMDCHMPKASLSGEPVSPHEADVSTHIFRIRTDVKDQRMFTLEGDFVRVDENNQAMVNLAFACKSCHAGQSDTWLSANAENFHDPSFSINGAMSGTWWAGLDRDGEGWLIDAAANAFVAAMYTYDGDGNQAWLMGVGAADGDVVSTAVEITDGPVFGAGYDPDDVNRTAWGTANFLFTSCTQGTVELIPNADMLARGFEAMTVNIERLTESAISCPGPN